jgi:uncharacterized membrane protein YecN with MAPEG domain
MLAFCMVMTARQLSQFTVELPIPHNLWFEHPGFPSLTVNYEVKNDFFFSGHTCLAVMVTLELHKIFSRWWLTLLGCLLSVMQMLLVLIFRTHYIQDVIAGLFAPFFVYFFAKRLARFIDLRLNHHTGVSTAEEEGDPLLPVVQSKHHLSDSVE